MQAGSKGDLVASRMPEGVSLQRDPIKFDAGTHFVLIDPTTRQAIGTVPKNLAEKEAQEKVGQARGQAQADLPRAKSTYDTVMKYVDDVINDKNLSNVVGWPAYVGTIRPESQATEERLKQLQGFAFLQAFESLKGAGAITEVEGQKATAALARLQNLKQDKTAYRAALEDFKRELTRGFELAQEKARGGVAPAQPPPPANNGWSMQKVQ